MPNAPIAASGTTIASVCGVKMDECVQLETTWDTSNASRGQLFGFPYSFGYDFGQYTSTTGASASAPARYGRAPRRYRSATIASTIPATTAFDTFTVVATLNAQPASASRIGLDFGERSSAAATVTRSVESGSS
jgi:hypothetical protein